MNKTKLSAAVYKAGQTAPFLRIPLASVTFIEDERTMSNGHPTTACDPFWRVYVHPDVTEDWTTSQLTHALLHEVSHLVRRHHKRLTGRPSAKANVAGDCEIESHSWPGLIRPPHGVTPGVYNLPTGLTAEAYFDLLPDFDDDNQTPDCGSGVGGHVRPWDLPKSAAPSVSDTKAEAIAQQVAEAIQRSGRGAGHAWMRWASEQLHPQVEWRRFVRQWLNSSRVKRGSSRLSSMNPRIKHGVMRRGWVGKKIRLNVVSDASGSMVGKPMALALAEVIGVAQTCHVNVYWQDAGDAPTVQVGVRRWSDLEPVGGGGTDLRPAIALAVADEPDGLIVVTDCDTPWEPVPPGVPTLVVHVKASPYSTSAPPPGWESVMVQ